jgi:hypothetical protein
MSHVRKVVLLLVVLVTLFAVPAVYAHRPVEANDEGVTQIPNPSTSYAFYEALTSPDAVDVYRVEAEAGQFLHAGINIPKLERLRDYGVRLALVGPGLPPLEGIAAPGEDGHAHGGAEAHADEHQTEAHAEEGHAHAGIPHPEAHLPAEVVADLASGAYGGVIVESVKSEDFYEPFTQTDYWGRQTLELDLPESGTYYLMIWQPQGETGKYVLDTGREEVFGPADLFRFPLWWIETRLYFEQTLPIVGALGLMVAAVLGLVVYRLR